jgi:hypothetical protein
MVMCDWSLISVNVGDFRLDTPISVYFTLGMF